MEKLDKKTIVGLIIAAIIVVIGIICLALFNSKGKPASEEELTAANNAYKEYVFSMTYGYGTKYDGIDKLYEKDETTYDTLHRNVILNAATRYATDHLEIAITKEKENALKTQYGYTNNYVAYNGDAVKEAVKILYGKEWEHGSGLNDNLFGYDFNYIATLDVYVRTKSVLDKLGYIPEFANINIELLNDEASMEVIRTLYKFNEVLESVTEKSEPSFLSRYLIELGQKYSNFYNENKIMVEDKEIQDARAYLTYAVGTVIKTGAGLLGIKMPTQM